jgi:hypothetical protein
MNRHIFRGSRTNRDRRDQSFARSVIATATRLHNEAIARLSERDPLDPFNRTLEETGRCCMARHQQAVAPWTCDCPCHTRLAEGNDAADIVDDIAASNARQNDYWRRVGGHPDAGYQDAPDVERCIWCSEEPQTEEHKPYCSNHCAVQAELS